MRRRKFGICLVATLLSSWLVTSAAAQEVETVESGSDAQASGGFDFAPAPADYSRTDSYREGAWMWGMSADQLLLGGSTSVSGDAGDKTINYELINGHSRNKVFFSRIIVGIGWGVLLVLVFNVIPLVYLSLINGWGDETSMRDVVLRSALAFFPIIRISTFSMLVATVARSKGKGLGYGYTIIMFWSLILSILDEFGIKTNYLGAEYDLMYLFVSEKTRNVVIGGKSVTIFDTAVSGDSMTKLIIVSLALSLVYIIVGFIYFKKTDRD